MANRTGAVIRAARRLRDQTRSTIRNDMDEDAIDAWEALDVALNARDDFLAASLDAEREPMSAVAPASARSDYVPPPDVRSYITDDQDVDEARHRLDVTRGDNGDWYLAILPAADRFTRSYVRITTSGSRRPEVQNAIADMWRALGPGAPARADEDPLNEVTADEPATRLALGGHGCGHVPRPGTCGGCRATLGVAPTSVGKEGAVR